MTKINICTTDFKTINISPIRSGCFHKWNKQEIDNTQMEKRSNFKWYLYESKILWRESLIFVPLEVKQFLCWTEWKWRFRIVGNLILQTDYFSPSRVRHTALLINCDFELWSITCIRLQIATSSVNSNMTKTALLVKSDFELWSVRCIEHELWSLTSFAHGQFNLFTTTI